MIYLLEDDDSIRDFVIYTLNSQGMEARGVGLPSEFWQAVAEEVPSLVLLDVMLPEEDGLTVLKKLRESARTAQLPVIMLTAKGETDDKVNGLKTGADDYITKPFEIEELLARIRAALRKRTALATGGNVLTSGALKLDPARHEVHCGGERIELTQREFALLQVLMENRSIVLSREKLLELVWDYDYAGETNVVDVYIRYLRAKIDDAYGVKYIHTVRGVGYVFRDA